MNVEHSDFNMTKQVKVDLSQFKVDNGVSEYHLMLHAVAADGLFEAQLLSVLSVYRKFTSEELTNVHPVFMRFFISDSANQSEILNSYLLSEQINCAVSIVEQAPLDGSKVALWVYLQSDVQTEFLPCGQLQVSHGVYQHYWLGNSFSNVGDSEVQTRRLLTEYASQLEGEGCTLADNCIRTWFFVQNVDVNYAGVVKARNEVFQIHNLTSKTHYISSTGINGRHADYNVLVQMGAYAVKGLLKEQIHFLYAKSHLNPTYEYGVSFERGTYVDYGDRRQVFISGTASIDNKGEILYLGNIRKQTERMLENVSVLLNEAECDFSHVKQIIVYLRDVSDYKVVSKMFDERFPELPKVIVHAPVCRPGWLIEMECMAVKSVSDNNFSNF